MKNEMSLVYVKPDNSYTILEWYGLSIKKQLYDLSLDMYEVNSKFNEFYTYHECDNRFLNKIILLISQPSITVSSTLKLYMNYQVSHTPKKIKH